MEVQFFFPTEYSFPNFYGLIPIFPNSTGPTSERQETPWLSMTSADLLKMIFFSVYL